MKKFIKGLLLASFCLISFTAIAQKEASNESESFKTFTFNVDGFWASDSKEETFCRMPLKITLKFWEDQIVEFEQKCESNDIYCSSFDLIMIYRETLGGSQLYVTEEGDEVEFIFIEGSWKLIFYTANGVYHTYQLSGKKEKTKRI